MKPKAGSSATEASRGSGKAPADDATILLDETVPQGQEPLLQRNAANLETASQLLADKTVVKDRFELESMLGTGGMGTVYKARDLRKVEASDRDPWVAIKLLNDDFREHPDALISLQREARKAQALTHPNIVKVFDFDRDGDTVFMIMELLRGQDLNQFIYAHPGGAGVSEALRLAREMGEALQHAHHSGLVHADFTPKNVFLTEEGTAKVLDFGIARAVASADTGPAPGDQTVFDPSSLGALTPSYASLERLNGEDPSPADDIYGLGCIIYELLSGDHPTDHVTARDAASQRIQPRRITALSGRQWRALKKAVAVSRQDRYTEVSDFLADFLPRQGGAAVPLALAAGIVVITAGAAAWQIYQTREGHRTVQAELAAEQRALAESRDMLQQEQTAKTQKVSEDLQRVNSEYLNLATTLIGNQQFDEAARLLERVRESTPDEPRLDEIDASLQASRDTHRQRIIQRHIDAIDGAMNSGQLQEASKQLDELATLAPENRHLDGLRSRLNRALEKNRIREDRIATLIMQAERLDEDDRAEERMDIYRQVLALDPRNRAAQEGVENARAALARADFESRQKAREESLASLRKARELFEQQPISAENYQRGYLYLLEAQQLDRQSQPLLDMLDELPQLYLDAIRETMSIGNYDEADRLFQSAVVLASADARFEQLRAELLKLAGEPQQPVLPASF